MKKYIPLLALLILGMFGCKKNNPATGTDAFFDRLAPVILINGSEAMSDTMKFSLHPEYAFSFTVEDDQTERFLEVENLQNGLLYFQGKIINDASTNISGIKNGLLTFKALEAGEFNFRISVKDPEGLTTAVVVDLNMLDNLLPVAKLELEQMSTPAPYQISIDGISSFDQDAKWGGKITTYEYMVDEFYTTESVRDKIEYIFPQPGTYTIGLRVKDNDGEWSDQLTKQISVQ